MAESTKEWAALWAARHAELVEKLKRLELRRREGWGYRKVLRKGYSVKAHKVRSHYAMLPVKRK